MVSPLYTLVIVAAMLQSILVSAEESHCGSAHLTGSTFMANLVGGRHLAGFESCCESHDICYDSCATKEHCDQNFKHCMKNECTNRSETAADYEECVNKSDIFVSAVETLGGFAYDDNCTSQGAMPSAQFIYDLINSSTADLMEMLP